MFEWLTCLYNNMQTVDTTSFEYVYSVQVGTLALSLLC